MFYLEKKISKSIIKRVLFLIFLFLLYFIISAISYTHATCTDITDNIFRLHVVANSDTEEDQNLKYIVRNEILNYINSITNNTSSKDDIIQITKNNIEEIKSIAIKTIHDNGYNYSVNVSVGNYSFPTKQYGDIKLPPGFYDALRIEIGEAKGQNWWCVMFPPLCFVDVTSGVVPDESKQIMKDNLSNEEYNLITKDDGDIKLKFKIVEVLQNFTISGIFM